MKNKPATKEVTTHKQRVRATSRILREFAVKPTSSEDVLTSYQREWFTSPHWRAQVEACVKALVAGNPTRLRFELDFSPHILADPVVQAILVQLWGMKFLKGPKGDFARKMLKVLFHNLWDTLGATEHETQAERDEAKRASQRTASKNYRQNRKPKRPGTGAS